MITKQQRLAKNEVEYILEKGKNIRSRSLILRYLKNKEKFPRYCVIISKKFDNKATNRNHVRRQIYESIRLNKIKPKKNHDIVIIPKKNILNLDFKEISTETSEILQSINN